MESRTEITVFLNRLAHDPHAISHLTPRSLEVFVAYLLTGLGYEVRPTPDGRHSGIDLLAELRDDVSYTAVGVKIRQYAPGKPLGVGPVREIHATSDMLGMSHALLVTTSRFTRGAQEFARQLGSVTLIDREKLIELAVTARIREEERAKSIAFTLNRLPLETLASLERPDLAHATHFALPDRFSRRMSAVDAVPLRLLHTVAGDPRRMGQLSPREFEQFVAELLDGIGFSNVVLTPRSYDGGKDVIASKNVSGIPLTFYFECKKYADGNKVQLDTLRSLLGVVAHDAREANIGVLVTTSTFTSGAHKMILSECRLDGKDYAGLTSWIRDYEGGFGV